MASNLKDLDLFSLMVFASIFDTQHANVTARQLGVSASKVSRCLNALRLEFDDELFYRRQTGLLPTPLAERLHPQVKLLIQGFELLQQLAYPEVQKHLQLKMAVMPAMLPVLAEVLQLPEYADISHRITLTPWRNDSATRLHQGEFDVGIAMEKPEFDDLETTLLRRFDCVNLVARNGHPIWADIDRFDLEMMADFPFIYQVINGFNDKLDPLEGFFLEYQLNHSGIEATSDKDEWYATLLSSDALSFIGAVDNEQLTQAGLRFWRLPEASYLRLHDKIPQPELYIIERQPQYRRYCEKTHRLLGLMSKKSTLIMK